MAEAGSSSPYLNLRSRVIQRPVHREALRRPEDFNSSHEAADFAYRPAIEARARGTVGEAWQHDVKSSTPRTAHLSESDPLRSRRTDSVSSLWHPGSTADLFDRWISEPLLPNIDEDSEVQLNRPPLRRSRDPSPTTRPAMVGQNANQFVDSRPHARQESVYDRGQLEGNRPHRSGYSLAPSAQSRGQDWNQFYGPTEAPIGSFRDHGGHRMTKRTSREVKPSVFDGSSVSFIEFVDDFERVADYNGWNAEDRKFHLWNSISGNARIRIKTMPYPASYEDLLRQLLLAFNNERSLEAYRDKLAAVKRDQSMDLETFGHHLLDLVRKAHPLAVPEEQERIARDRFVETAGSHNLFVWLKANKPRTVQAAIDLAIQFQQATAANTVKKPIREAANSELALTNLFIEEKKMALEVSAAVPEAVQNSESALEKQVKTLAEQIQALTDQLKQPKAPKGPLRCYNCNELGHIKRNCPQLKSLN